MVDSSSVQIQKHQHLKINFKIYEIRNCSTQAINVLKVTLILAGINGWETLEPQITHSSLYLTNCESQQCAIYGSRSSTSVKVIIPVKSNIVSKPILPSRFSIGKSGFIDSPNGTSKSPNIYTNKNKIQKI